MGIQQYDESAPLVGMAQIVNADGTGVVTLDTSTTARRRYDSILVTSTAVADHKLTIWTYVGAFGNKLGVVNIPAGAGSGAVPGVEVIAGLALGNVGAIVLPPVTDLKAKLEVTLGAGELMYITLLGGSL